MRKHEAEIYFQNAAARVEQLGYAFESTWQEEVLNREVSEQDFLREYAWVIYNSGFRESVVRKWFGVISLAFYDFVSSSLIVSDLDNCVRLAQAAISHRGKSFAIAKVAKSLSKNGFENFWGRVVLDPKNELLQLPFIGNITVSHLLKNLGFDHAKNDRHLFRVARTFEFHDAEHLCSYLSDRVGRPKSVVDIILWRFSELSGRGIVSVEAA